ncbi:hypothetical protein [Paracoccus sp. SY]|uniref:DUF7940 domain-containing protein n=1 Tax=Paracoccus sp. SY TaxID=1330255 RepID=UPI000CD19A4F|nr:hypothetical protein [Paracoccus sp. SY]
MKLIPQWRSALRMYSIQILLFIAALPAAWEAVPDEIKLLIPLPWLPWITTALAIAGIVARLVDQRSPEQRKADEVRNEVDGMSDAAVADRLRDRADR